MDRLTERDEFGNADIIALSDMMPEIYAGLSFSETNALTDVLNRLAAYEDTGLTPEQVAAYAKAEAEGRLIVLPCKVGGELWVNDQDGKPRKMILDAPDIRCHCANEDNLCMVTCDNPRFGFCAFRLKNDGGSLGKTVFTSREAAEAALKEAQQG